MTKRKTRKPALQFKRLSPAEQQMARLAPGDGLKGFGHIESTMGGSLAYWMRAVEQTIRHVSKPLAVAKAKKLGLATKGHSECDPRKVVQILAHQVAEQCPTMADGNMFMAQTLGLILVGWAVRIARAKAYDPNRPLILRRYALERWQKFCTELLTVCIDERSDAEVWPGQKWDPPFTAAAKDGRFL